MVGDVNGDGQLDVVAVTKTGDCWVLNGQTGESLKNFPIKLGCSIHSSPLLLKLDSVRYLGGSFIVDGFWFIDCDNQ